MWSAKFGTIDSALPHTPRSAFRICMNLATLDLHGYTVAAGMRRFVMEYNRLLTSDRYDGLNVIHGRGHGGEGVLREAVRACLQAQGTRIKGFDAQLLMRGAEYLLDVPGRCAYAHGEDAMRNGGCTIVVPRQRLQLPPEWSRY